MPMKVKQKQESREESIRSLYRELCMLRSFSSNSEQNVKTEFKAEMPNNKLTEEISKAIIVNPTSDCSKIDLILRANRKPFSKKIHDMNKLGVVRRVKRSRTVLFNRKKAGGIHAVKYLKNHLFQGKKKRKIPIDENMVMKRTDIYKSRDNSKGKDDKIKYRQDFDNYRDKVNCYVGPSKKNDKQPKEIKRKDDIKNNRVVNRSDEVWRRNEIHTNRNEINKKRPSRKSRRRDKRSNRAISSPELLRRRRKEAATESTTDKMSVNPANYIYENVNDNRGKLFSGTSREDDLIRTTDIAKFAKATKMNTTDDKQWSIKNRLKPHPSGYQESQESIPSCIYCWVEKLNGLLQEMICEESVCQECACSSKRNSVPSFLTAKEDQSILAEKFTDVNLPSERYQKSMTVTSHSEASCVSCREHVKEMILNVFKSPPNESKDHPHFENCRNCSETLERKMYDEVYEGQNKKRDGEKVSKTEEHRTDDKRDKKDKINPNEKALDCNYKSPSGLASTCYSILEKFNLVKINSSSSKSPGVNKTSKNVDVRNKVDVESDAKIPISTIKNGHQKKKPNIYVVSSKRSLMLCNGSGEPSSSFCEDRQNQKQPSNQKLNPVDLNGKEYLKTRKRSKSRKRKGLQCQEDPDTVESRNNLTQTSGLSEESSSISSEILKHFLIDMNRVLEKSECSHAKGERCCDRCGLTAVEEAELANHLEEIRKIPGWKKPLQYWAVTKVCIYPDESKTYEVMTPSPEKPRSVPSSADSVFVLLPPAVVQS